ncbi:unnamed protein product [Calypogeia fissa]
MESLGAMAVSTSCSSITVSAPLCHSRSRISRSSSISTTQPSKGSLLLASPTSGGLLQRRIVKSSFPLSHYGAASRRVGLNVITSQAKSEDVDSIGAVGVGAIVGGLVCNPVVGFSLYTLKTTGCGLPPGPGGSIGAIEGVSYLVILGVIGWSIYTKVKTGSGLPQGPFGLLGAVEGISYLTLLAIVVVFGLQALDFGFIPGPLPGKECFG